jgi:hypothetical protein
MFDEMFPGMGLAGMYGMDPYMGMAFGGMQQYRQPGADVFSSLGIMTPQQKMFQGISMQNMLEQQQLARQQQMMALQMEGQNIGVNAAKVGSGFAGPMLMAMGGMNSPLATRLPGAIAQAFGPQQGQGSGMMGMPPGQGGDVTSLLNFANEKFNGDPGKAYAWAGQQLSRWADQTGDPQAREQAVRLSQMGFNLSQEEANKAADTARLNAQAGESAQRTKTLQAEMLAPKPMGTGHDMSGNEGLVWAQYNPQTNKYEQMSGFWGPAIAYAVPNTPGGADKNLDTFQTLADNGSKAITRLNQLETQVRNGAPIGWAQEGASFFNDVLGTLKQVVPGTNISPDVQQYMNGTYGNTFQDWATKGEIAESTAQDMVMTLASSFAAGHQVSRADIDRAEKVVGTATSNPETLLPVLNMVKQRTSADLDRAYAFYKARGGTPAYLKSLDGVHQEYYRQIGSPATNGGSGNGGAAMSLDDYLRGHGY